MSKKLQNTIEAVLIFVVAALAIYSGWRLATIGLGGW